MNGTESFKGLPSYQLFTYEVFFAGMNMCFMFKIITLYNLW